MPHTELDVLRRATRDLLGHPLATVQVHPDSLPQFCPAPLPHPEGFILVGTVEAAVSPRPERGSASVFFETPHAVEPARQVLGQGLLTLGWEEGGYSPPAPTGFCQAWEEEPAPSTRGLPHFYLHPATRWVALVRGRPEAGVTTVILRLEGGHAYDLYRQRGQEAAGLLPRLNGPSGMTVHLLDGSTGRSGELAHARTMALLAGPGTTLDLQNHFTGELGRQGWALERQVSMAALWTSTWRRETQGPRQTGTLLLAQVGPEVWQAHFDGLQIPAGRDSLDWSAFLG